MFGDYIIEVLIDSVVVAFQGASLNTDGLRRSGGALGTNEFVPLSLMDPIGIANFGFTILPTAVELKYLKAELAESGEGVRVLWETATETDNLGFNIYRKLGADGEMVLVNPTIILGVGTGTGKAYQYLDDTELEPGSYEYWLEDMEFDFDKDIHGPAILVITAPEGDFVETAVAGEEEPETTTVTDVVIKGEIGYKGPGVYRIDNDLLSTVNLQDYSLIQVLIDGEPVPAFVADGQYILFYVPEGSVKIALAESYTNAPLRMNEKEAKPRIPEYLLDE